MTASSQESPTITAWRQESVPRIQMLANNIIGTNLSLPQLQQQDASSPHFHSSQTQNEEGMPRLDDPEESFSDLSGFHDQGTNGDYHDLSYPTQYRQGFADIEAEFDQHEDTTSAAYSQTEHYPEGTHDREFNQSSGLQSDLTASDSVLYSKADSDSWASPMQGQIEQSTYGPHDRFPEGSGPDLQAWGQNHHPAPSGNDDPIFLSISGSRQLEDPNNVDRYDNPTTPEQWDSPRESFAQTSDASRTSYVESSTPSSLSRMHSVSSSRHSQENPDWGESSGLTVRPEVHQVRNGDTLFQLHVRGYTPPPPGTRTVNRTRKKSPPRNNLSPHDPHDKLSPGATSPASSSTSEVLHCEDCAAGFTGKFRKGNWSRHRRTIHGEEIKTYPCEDDNCDKSFARSDARVKHYRKHHPHLSPGPAVPRKRGNSSAETSDMIGTDQERKRQLSQDLRSVGARY